MLDQLFKYPGVLARHQAAPLLDERERYLAHRTAQGLAPATLTYLAGKLRILAYEMALEGKAKLTSAEIEQVASRCTQHWQNTPCSQDSRTPPRVFIRIATDWLRFLHRLQSPAVKEAAVAPHIADFLAALRNERGLSPKTIRCYEWFIVQFCDWLATQHSLFSAVSMDDIDTFLAERGQRWCRISVATAAKALRSFFRYAERQHWCRAGLAEAIESPRLFRQETLPTGPDWAMVQQLIEHTNTDRARDIRDRAILILLAIYGLRSGEVANLELEQLDWAKQRLTVRRPKQRFSQEYPLIPVLGIALARYLKAVRPGSTRREVFLTLRAPVRPLSAGALYHLTRTRLAELGYGGPHYGPHTLRYACAAQLVAQQLSLKEIGDHLGHRSTYATRTYAKVDLEGLREVARFDLGALL